MMHKLGKPLPCPFCGMEPTLEDDINGNGQPMVYWSHEDAFPGCVVAFIQLTNKEDVDQWNKRNKSEGQKP